MTKNLLIIGGGITGCLAALYARKKNLKVTLHEKKGYLGGVLRDVTKNNLSFFNGCQYLNTKNSWLNIIKELHQNLTFFKVNYGSYTNFEKEIITKKFPGPVFETNKISLKKTKINSLTERIESYPEDVSKNIKFWLKINNVNSDKLSHQSCEPISIKRVYIRNKTKQLQSKKKKNLHFDDYYGLPHKINNNLISAIPKYGYNKFFDEMAELLKKKKIKLNLNSLIKVTNAPEGIKIINTNNEIKFDHILWCSSPTLVFMKLEKKKLDSEYLKLTNYFFKIKKKYKNFFVQVFDNKTKIFRIGVYSLAGNNHICLEAFDDNIRIDYLEKKIVSILKGFDINFEDDQISYIGKYDTKRYVFTTKKDLKSIISFRKKYKKRFIDGSWEIYSRDDKLKNIFDQIDNIK